jgi:hypothetical protein
MKIVNRGWLKKQIEKGNIEIKCEQVLTDDYAFDAAFNFQKSDWVKADIKNFNDQDFKFKTGRAYWSQDGTISWTMLCNHYYTCRLINK